MLTEREDDVGHSEEAVVKIRLHGGIDVTVPRTLNANSDHCYHNGRENTDECCNPYQQKGPKELPGWILTCNGQPRHLRQGPRQGADEGDNKPNDSKDNGACPVVRKRVHHHRERKDMATHDEDKEQQLGNSQELSPPSPEHYLSGIRHAVNMRIPQLELPDHISGVCCENAKTDEENDSP